MTSQRLNSQPNPVEPQSIPRQASEPVLPKDGIRPTREGPWDPCRFQEYEVSPEFRRQIMSAKPPPADPRIFQDTLPSRGVSDLTSSTQANQDLGAGAPNSGVPDSREQPPTRYVQRRRRIFAILVVSGALLGLIAGYRMSQPKTHGTKADTRSAEMGNTDSK